MLAYISKRILSGLVTVFFYRNVYIFCDAFCAR